MGMPVFPTLAAAVVAVADAEAPVVIDLTIPQPCAEANDAAISGEIVVCAEVERQSLYRLRNADRQNDRTLPKAEFALQDGVSLAVETENADLGMARAQRALVRLKFKF